MAHIGSLAKADEPHPMECGMHARTHKTTIESPSFCATRADSEESDAGLQRRDTTGCIPSPSRSQTPARPQASPPSSPPCPAPDCRFSGSTKFPKQRRRCEAQRIRVCKWEEEERKGATSSGDMLSIPFAIRSTAELLRAWSAGGAQSCQTPRQQVKSPSSCEGGGRDAVRRGGAP